MSALYLLGYASGLVWRWSPDAQPGGPYGITEDERADYRAGWRAGLVTRAMTADFTG